MKLTWVHLNFLWITVYNLQTTNQLHSKYNWKVVNASVRFREPKKSAKQQRIWMKGTKKLQSGFLPAWNERKEFAMVLRVNSRVSAKIILVLGPNFGNPQSHGSKTPNRLRKFRNGTCNSNNLEQKYGNTGLSTLHFRTLQIFTITQTQKID